MEKDSEPPIIKGRHKSPRAKHPSPKNPVTTGQRAGRILGATAMTVAGFWGSSSIKDMVNSTGQEIADPISISFAQGSDQTEKKERVERRESAFDIVFHDLSPEEKNLAESKVSEAKLKMEQLITPEALERMRKHTPLVTKTANDYGIPPQLFLGLVMAESLGDEKAISPVSGAGGLTQIMPENAANMGLVMDGECDERLIPEKVLPATAKDLLRRYELFGDWGLTLQSWHLGEGETAKAVAEYMKQKNAILPSLIVEPRDNSQDARDEAYTEGLIRKQKYKTAVGENNLSVLQVIFKNPHALENYTGPGWDFTTEYLPRIVASSEIFSTHNPSQASIDMGKE